MKLNDYLKFLSETQSDITLEYDQSNELCEDISKKRISDIPKKYHNEIESLLIERLNSNAVESHLVAPLEKMLASLREEQATANRRF